MENKDIGIAEAGNQEMSRHEKSVLRRLALSMLSPEVSVAISTAFTGLIPVEKQTTFQAYLEKGLGPTEEDHFIDDLMSLIGNLPQDRKKPLLTVLDSYLKI